MTKINLKKLRFIPIITQIQKDYKLTYEQAAVYGYIFNQCMNLRDDGFCGYSDERMASEMGIGYRTFQRDLERLKKENLIVVKNPGKRTKKTNESRMIYINTAVYLEEEQMSLVDIELENLKKENERLKKQLKMQIQENETHEIYSNVYTMNLYVRLSKLGMIDESRKKELYAALSGAYEGLAVNYGNNIVMQHIHYMLEQIEKHKPDNVIAYLSTSFYKLERELRKNKKFNDAVKEYGYDQAFLMLMRGDLNGK